MPLYDFECEKCGNRFEELVSSYRNVDKVECPECSSSELKRVYDGKHFLGIITDSASDFSDYSDYSDYSDFDDDFSGGCDYSCDY